MGGHRHSTPIWTRVAVVAVLALLAGMLPSVAAVAADPVPGAHEREYNPTDLIANETTVYVPSTVMPPGGWPVLIFGHGLLGSKADLVQQASGAANQGFLAVAPSVPQGEAALLDRALHVSRILDGLLAEFGDVIDDANIGVSGVSGGSIGALLFFNERSKDDRIKTVNGSIGFPLDHPSQIETPFDWSLPKPLYLANNWRDESVPYDLVRAGWRQAAGPRFLFTRFVQGHGGENGLPQMSAADTAFSNHFLKGDAAALDTLLHAYDTTSYASGVFEFHLPGAPDLVIDPIDPVLHVDAGAPVTHRYLVTNQGTEVSPSASLRVSRQVSLTTDPSPGCAIEVFEVTCAVPSLDPGQSFTVAVHSTASAAPDVNDIARIVATLDLPGLRAAAFGETAIGSAVSQFPDLEVRLEADRASVDDSNPTVTYTTDIVNTGGNVAQNVRLVLEVDPSLQPADLPCVHRPSFGVLSCKLAPQFPSGARDVQSFTFTRTAATPTTPLAAAARVVNGYMDGDLADNTATALVTGNPGVPRTADVFVFSSLPNPAATVGATTSITTTFGTRGQSVARGGRLIRRLPAGMDAFGYPEACTLAAAPAPAPFGSTDLTCVLPDIGPWSTFTSSLQVRVTPAINSCHLQSTVRFTTTTAISNPGDDESATTSVVEAGNCFRLVSGRVTYLSGALPPGSAPAGVGACPLGSLLPAPGCVGYKQAIADADGNYVMPVLTAVDYRIGGFAYFGALRSPTRDLLRGSAFVPGFDFDLPAFGSLAGHVDATGFTGTPGVIACLGSVAITQFCNGIRTTSVNPTTGEYSLVLGPGTYTVAAFLPHQSGFLVTPPTSVTIASGTETPLSFSLANAAPGTPNVATVPTPDDGSLTISAGAGLALSNVSTAPLSTATTPPPAGFQFETGVLSFTIRNVPLGATVPVTLTFDTDLGDDVGYFKYDGTTWTPHTQISRPAGDPRTLIVHLTDGGPGDEDRTANGVIVDPGAVGRAVPEGFFRPVDMAPVVNVAKAGSTVPLKWYFPLVEGGGLASVQSSSVGCPNAVSDAIETTSGSSGLQDLGGGYWQWNWKTSTTFSGCRILRMTFTDGSVKTATFDFR